MECTSRNPTGSTLLSEWPGRLAGAAIFGPQWHTRIAGGGRIANEVLATLRLAGPLDLEWPTPGVQLLIPGSSNLEWTDPPALLVDSPEPLWRSPGRIRVLERPQAASPRSKISEFTNANSNTLRPDRGRQFRLRLPAGRRRGVHYFAELDLRMGAVSDGS